MSKISKLIMATIFLTGLFLGQVQAKPVLLDWDALIPDDNKGVVLPVPENSPIIGALRKEDYEDLSKDEFDESVEFFNEQRSYQASGSSIRIDLNGKTVRIAGYITPVEIDGENVISFLLVPYLGACIHVPAPPSNQIIYISGVKKLKLDEIYDPVWVTGSLEAKPLTTIYAEAGYRIANAEIKPYQE